MLVYQHVQGFDKGHGGTDGDLAMGLTGVVCSRAPSTAVAAGVMPTFTDSTS